MPIYILLKKGQTTTTVYQTGWLILLGVFAKRYFVIISGYLRRWSPYAPKAVYWPTLPEIFLVLGIFSITILVFNLIKSLFFTVDNIQADPKALLSKI